MRKLTVTALFLGALFCAKAQSIKIIKTCGEPQTVVNFVEVDAYSQVVKQHHTASQCATQEFPKYRLEVGNYEFRDLVIPDGEQWFIEIKQGNSIVKKGFLSLNHFEVLLKEDMSIAIYISPKPKCNCN
jgi:hypothetical protein